MLDPRWEESWNFPRLPPFSPCPWLPPSRQWLSPVGSSSCRISPICPLLPLSVPSPSCWGPSCPLTLGPLSLCHSLLSSYFPKLISHQPPPHSETQLLNPACKTFHDLTLIDCSGLTSLQGTISSSHAGLFCVPGISPRVMLPVFP